MRVRLSAVFPVLAVALCAVPALPAPSEASTTPASYSVTTAAAAVQVVSTQRPAFSIATGDLVDQTLGLVSSDFGASTSQARAASYYPGDLLAQAGQLICGQFGPCPFDPPTYPLLAEASWPTVDHATAGQGAAASTATASATSTSAVAGGSQQPLGGLSVGSLSSSTTTRALPDGLHVRVTSVVHDVALGPLSVALVQVTDDVLVRPDGRRTASPRVVVSGASVAGHAVELTETPLPALAQQGLSARVVGTDTAGARSGGTGLRLDLSVPVSGVGAPLPGLPSLDRSYVGSVVVGQASVIATRDDALDLPVLPTTPSLHLSPTAVPGTVLPPVEPPPAARPAAPTAAQAAPGLVLTRRTGGLENVDLAGLYAVLALAAALCLGTSRALSRRAWHGAAA